MYYNINFSKYVIITMNFKGGKFSSACFLIMIDYKGQDYTFTYIYVPKS